MLKRLHGLRKWNFRFKKVSKKRNVRMAVNFLPICDLLFNFISVASYFCDVAFDIIVTYTLYQSETVWFLVLLVNSFTKLLIVFW